VNVLKCNEIWLGDTLKTIAFPTELPIIVQVHRVDAGNRVISMIEAFPFPNGASLNRALKNAQAG